MGIAGVTFSTSGTTGLNLDPRSLRIASINFSVTFSKPLADETARRSASRGERSRICLAEMLCHTGSITFTPSTSLATSPSSSFWGHSFSRKLGLITTIPNRGPFVAEITWDEAREIYQVRALLEGEAAALFARRATAAEKREMAQGLASFIASDQANDAIGRLTSTSRFYEVMLRGCGNSVISDLLQGLVARINFLRARSMSRAGRTRHSASELRRILKAIEKNDSAGARAAAVDHVRAACVAAEAVFEPRKAA